MKETIEKYDVIIVGSGPAGSTAASIISKQGFRTLLIDKSDFPRDKSCGDGLTRTTTKLLYQLGLLEKFSAFQKIYGANVFVEKEGSREFVYPEHLVEPNFGLVVPRFELDNILHQYALESGADFIGKSRFENLLYSDTRKVIGIELSNGKKYFADIVIAADGAASKIAYEAGLAMTPKNKLGFGLRAYYKNISELTDKLEIYLPVLDNSNTRVLPSYGWVFPVSKTQANIGVGLMEKIDNNNIHSVMERFVAKLKSTDSRFREIELDGKFIGAPMRFDFKPDSTYAPGLLLIGDAAGLISPFTGEGIGYAIETAILAAEYYLQLRESGEKKFVDMAGYGKKLATKYQGYFETGLTAVNRYHMVWKVLRSTFQNDKPLFNTIRQATVFPEAIGESFFDHYTQDISKLIKWYNAEIKTDMLTISANLIDITRTDWPFLSRLFSAKQVTPGIPFRPAVFILLSGYCDKTDRDTMIKIGTAIELGFAASLCHESVIEEDDRLNDSPNWGNMTSILLGDFLLSKSFEVLASLETKYMNIISEALSASNKGYIILKDRIEKEAATISIEDYIEYSYMKNKYSFELFLHLGGLVKKASQTEIDKLKDFGKRFGAAYFIIEDTLKYLEKIKYPHISRTNIFYAGNEQMSLRNVLTSQGSTLDVAVKKCFDTAEAEMEKAIAKINNLSDETLKQSLMNISKFVMQKAQLFE